MNKTIAAEKRAVVTRGWSQGRVMGKRNKNFLMMDGKRIFTGRDHSR